MSYSTPDAYNQPDKFGLQVIGTVQWEEDNYSFDLTAVFKDEHGNLYWADDAGCSCPSPFEDYTSVDKLETGTPEQLQAHLSERLAGTSWKGDTWTPAPASAVAEIMAKVRA